MWSNLLLLFVFLVFSYVFKNITRGEPNPVRYHSKFFVYYFTTSVFAALLFPFFLLRPRDVRNSK